MRRGLERTRVAVAALHGADCDALVEALRRARVGVETCDTADSLAAVALAGDVHAVVLATRRPDELPKPAVLDLISIQTDVSVTFLVPDCATYWQHAPLRAATPDQVRDISSPAEQLVEMLRMEVSSVLVSQPEYLVLCVDDDRTFLASLESLLPPRLERECPRFGLRFEFHDSPAEALSLVGSSESGELALVISDQVMPEMTGVDMLARVKTIRPRAQRVLLTGHAGLDSAIVAINERVLDKYLTKPIDQPVDFVNAVKHLLREYHLDRSRSVDRRRLMSQFELIRALSRAQDLPSMIQAVDVCLSEQLCPSRRWAVLVREGGALRVHGASRLPEELTPAQPLPLGDGLPGWVLRNNRPVFSLRGRDLPAGVESLVPAPLMAVPLTGQESAIGLVLLNCPRNASPLSRSERVLMSFVADAAAVTVSGLLDRQALQDHYVSTMASLMETVEAKDIYTRGHTDRVCELALALGRECGMSEAELKDLERAALLHDIGKIAVPDAIIAKEGALTSEEFAVIRQHPARGERILQHIKLLDHARLILRSHHERYDGDGYPDELKGEEIPIGARMLSIADTYDAMTSARPYRDAIPPDAALDEIECCAGRQFDPVLVRKFIDLMRPQLDRACSQAGPTKGRRPYSEDLPDFMHRR